MLLLANHLNLDRPTDLLTPEPIITLVAGHLQISSGDRTMEPVCTG